MDGQTEPAARPYGRRASRRRSLIHGREKGTKAGSDCRGLLPGRQSREAGVPRRGKPAAVLFGGGRREEAEDGNRKRESEIHFRLRKTGKNEKKGMIFERRWIFFGNIY
jgi:hypothetical protein